MIPRVVGLCGPEGAGKSTVGKLITELYGAELRPFAGPLKEMLAVLGVPQNNLYGTPQDKLEPLALLGGKTLRHAAQTLGTEWGRAHIDEDLWVRAWRLKAEKALVSVVADDLRFANEAATVRAFGGEIICVVRALSDFHRKAKHPSEDFASIKAKWILLNDGSLEDLKATIVGMFGPPDRDAAEPLPPGIVPMPSTLMRATPS